MKTLLIILGAPLWVPILIMVAILVFLMYTVLWVVIVTFWVLFASLAVAAPASIIIGLINVINVNVLYGCNFIGLGFISVGLALLAFYCCMFITKLSINLTKEVVSGMRRQS